MFLLYIPEFRAKSESEACPLPRSFWVRSSTDFVGSLPDELLLCPVRALCIYLDRTSSLSPRPGTLFVSPRCPSRPLPKNALSFFLRRVILQSFLASPPVSLPSASSSSVSGPSLVRAHRILAMATSAAFARNVTVSDHLEAATWRSSSVFTSSYFRDVQFESSQGFSLGPVVAAGAVI